MLAATNADILALVRVWVTETHIRIPESGTYTTPPLFDSEKATEETAYRLSFDWQKPTILGKLPEVSEVKLVTSPVGEPKKYEDVSGPEQLFELLKGVAKYRCGSDTDPEVFTKIKLDDIQQAQNHIVEAVVQALAHTGLTVSQAEAVPLVTEEISDGSDLGHIPGAWARGTSFFFPSLSGTATMDASVPGEYWIRTDTWGGPVEKLPALTLDDLGFSRVVAKDPQAVARGWTLREPISAIDAKLIADWMNLPHLASTFRQAWSERAWLDELSRLIAAPNTKPYVLQHDGVDAGYAEVYRPAWMNIGFSRPTDPRCVGIHIGMAEVSMVAHGTGRMLLRTLSEAILLGSESLHTVGLGEPDLRNPAMRGAVSGAGIAQIGQLVFPNKCASLCCLPRARSASA